MTNSKNAHNRQMALIGSERWNWMGHQGTETEELDMLMLRPLKNAPGFSDYAHRQLTIAEIRERLYAIKSDLGLLSEEEIRAEEEARERRRAERAERLRREQEEAERRRLEEEERRAEEERRRIAAEEYARRWAELEAAGELTDEATRRRQTLLEGMARNQTEINNGAEGVSFGARSLLVSLDAGYVSYLDGSVHTSVAKLEQYNANHIVATRFALRNTKVSLPNEGAFHTFDLNETIEARNLARKKLDAFRAIRDPTYASRLRSSEKDGSGRPTTAVTEEDGDEAALLGKVEESKDKAERVRKEYNKRAAASGERVQVASCSQVQEGQAQESAPVVADSSEKEEEAAAPVVEEAEPVAEQEQPEEEQKEQEEEEAPKTPGFDTAEY